MSVSYQQKLLRKNQKFASKTKINQLEMQMKDLDYSNFENDEIPDDFVCFNVPITQSLNELSRTTNEDDSTPVQGAHESDSTVSSPILSDDSFTFPNLQNNSRAFNILDSEVQNLTLEFNSNLSFLKSEQLTQQKINKKKINDISKKLSKNEKFWVSFLNECHKYSNKNSNETLSNAFANQFNVKLSNHMIKYSVYNAISDRARDLDKLTTHQRPSADVLPYNPIFRPISVFSEREYNPNSVDSEAGDFTCNPSQQAGACDLRYKKKYALPNNHSVDSLTQTDDLPLANTLYSIVNGTSSTLSIDSEQSTPRSSVLSVGSLGSLFRTSSFSNPSSPTPNKERKQFYMPEWWNHGLSTSPLPPLLLKFSLSNGEKNAIEQPTLRSICWYLSTTNSVLMTQQTFAALNEEVTKFSKQFDSYVSLIAQMKNKPDSQGVDKTVRLVQQLKCFLHEFKDKQKFQYQLKVFKTIIKEVQDLEFGPDVMDHKTIRNNLKLVLLNFYFYLNDIGETDIDVTHEVIGFAFIILQNVKDNYLSFNCLLNIYSKKFKIPLLKYLVFEPSTDYSDGSQIELHQGFGEMQESLNVQATKTFIKCLRSQLPVLYGFFRTSLNFDHHSKFLWMLKLVIRKIFSPKSIGVDPCHRQFLERLLDVTFMDKNNNLLVYLVIIFLKTYQDAFLSNLSIKLHEIINNLQISNNVNQQSVQRSISMTVKSFIETLNCGENELLFKHNDVHGFIGELRMDITEDLASVITADAVVDFIQLGFDQ